jgi:hypothetical protein
LREREKDREKDDLGSFFYVVTTHDGKSFIMEGGEGKEADRPTSDDKLVKVPQRVVASPFDSIRFIHFYKNGLYVLFV